MPPMVFPEGASVHGIAENFSTTPPLFFHGNSKLAFVYLALEYGEAFRFPISGIHRCGVLAGAGRFGKSRPRDLFFLLDKRLICAARP